MHNFESFPTPSTDVDKFPAKQKRPYAPETRPYPFSPTETKQKNETEHKKKKNEKPSSPKCKFIQYQREFRHRGKFAPQFRSFKQRRGAVFDRDR